MDTDTDENVRLSSQLINIDISDFINDDLEGLKGREQDHSFDKFIHLYMNIL